MDFRRIFKSRKWLVIFSLMLVFTLSTTISIVIYNKIKGDIYKEKEASAISSGKILNRYIVDTYELYYSSGTLKFQEIMGQIDDVSKDFYNFQIIAVDGNILFDSKIKDLGVNEGPAKSELRSNILSSNEVHVEKSRDSIDYIVVPHIDDWDNHKYSVKYFVNYSDVNEKLRSFETMIFTVSVGIDIMLIFIITFFSFNEKYRIEKERGRDLVNINKIKDEFMILVSHNLRTPLSIVRGYMSFIADPNVKKEELNDNIKDMSVGVNRLSDLVEDIVFATAIIDGEAKFENEKIDINKLVEEIKGKHTSQMKDKNLHFSYVLRGQEHFMGDKKSVNLIVDNLFENAIKFNSDGGIVDVKIKNGLDLKIAVTDTGVGIDKERLDSLVGFFHRGSETLDYSFEGEGVGLYLTNLIINHYNGQMHVKSEKGKGSTFEVVLRKPSDGY